MTDTNTLIKTEANTVPMEPGFNSIAGFEALQRMAKLLATCSMVPDNYKNNLSDCSVALNMAIRMKLDPIMVMQNLYVVYGRPSWSAQFMISMFNSCGRYSSIRYEEVGEPGKDSYGCRAVTIEKDTGLVTKSTTITIGMAKAEGWYGKKGSKWQTMPEQMLRYRAATFLIRTTAPELSMGLLTKDEAEEIGPSADPIDVAQREAAAHANSEDFKPAKSPAKKKKADEPKQIEAEVVPPTKVPEKATAEKQTVQAEQSKENKQVEMEDPGF